MMSRIWYPQLDIYHAIRRISTLLYFWEGKTTSLERLYISDFYLANPPLLHSVHMPSTIRDAFRELGVQKPEKSFLTYPTPSILFHKMAPIQKKALQAMVAKGILDSNKLQQGMVSLSDFGEQFSEEQVTSRMSQKESKLIDFLTSEFNKISEDDTTALRKRTGLRRMS